MSFSLFRVFLVNEVQKARKFSLSNEKRDVNCFELMRKKVRKERGKGRRHRQKERKKEREREREMKTLQRRLPQKR